MLVEVPHFAYPFTFTPAGRAAVVEQDSEDEIAACIVAILSYPLGSRPDLPDFGVADEAFMQGGPQLGEIREAIAAWEPRADAVVDLTDEYLTNAIATVNVVLAQPTEALS